MKQKSDTPQNQSAWPDGWYVYDNNKVEGPFTASQTFARDAMSGDGKQVLVSRKGFTQWYALKDLAEIFKMTDNLGRRVSEEKELLAAMNLAAAGEQRPSEKEPSGQRVLKKQVGPAQPSKPFEPVKVSARRDVPAQASAAVGENKASTPVAAKVPLVVAKTKTSAKVKMPEYAPPAANPTPIAAKESAKKSAPAKETASEKQRLLQEYFFVRGRLRLGKIRNPWAAAFFGVPVSVGLFWPYWMQAILKEIYLHATGNTKIPSWLVLASIIPGLHFFAIYKTASLMRAMEMQNRYQSISPTVATLFGIFPPFALAYLQDGANRHWLLHARHANTGSKPN